MLDKLLESTQKVNNEKVFEIQLKIDEKKIKEADDTNDSTIPVDILEIMWEELSNGRTFKQIVDIILDTPQGRDWFENWEGNEFDLRQELEGVYEDERDDVDEAKKQLKSDSYQILYKPQNYLNTELIVKLNNGKFSLVDSDGKSEDTGYDTLQELIDDYHIEKKFLIKVNESKELEKNFYRIGWIDRCKEDIKDIVQATSEDDAVKVLKRKYGNSVRSIFSVEKVKLLKRKFGNNVRSIFSVEKVEESEKIKEGKYREGAWVVGSLRGQDIDELYGDDKNMVMVIIESQDGKTVGICGSGDPTKQSGYGAIGAQVEVDIDDMQANYRPLGNRDTKWKIKAYTSVSKAEAQKYKCRALYYFD
jgi:hypothetical protein